MAYDIYSTAFLNRVVDELAPVPTVFLDLFFPEVLTHDTEEVYFDKVTDKPRLTPFVHPLHEGKVVDSVGYSTKSVKPAYLKDLRVHNPIKALKRRAGEALTGSLTPAQRQQANIVADLADQNRMFMRRMEVMAIEAVRDGRATIVGEGAGEMLASFTLAMTRGIRLNRLLSTIHPYPTRSEAVKATAGVWKNAHKPERLLGWLARYFAWRRKEPH